MFSKLAFFVASTLAVVAVAAPSGTSSGGISDSCNTGTIQCCNSVQDHTDDSREFFRNYFGASEGDFDTQYGTVCSPTTVAGVGGGSSCSSQPVCCNGNSFTGLIVMGCSSINTA